MMARLAMIMSLFTVLGVGALIYLAFFDDVVPMTEQRLAAIEGIGVGSTAYIIITRELCFTRANDAETIRIFTRPPGTNSDALRDEPEEVYTAPPLRINFNPGCDTRSRRLDVPLNLRPGNYLFSSGLRYCNDIGRCQTVWLDPFELEIVGEGPRRLLRPRRIP